MQGINDSGYPVIQNRMKSSARVVDELRAMYKERADIEAEYAKRLAKLARQTFGKDETGSMRAAIETVRTEIDRTSKTHTDLSNLIKKDMEGQLADFLVKSHNQRKASAVQIEKLFKQKQTQELYVVKSKDKYEQDCIKINGYTAQSSLVQGRDLDKVTTKLDKAQSTVSSNDKDYQNFVRALKDTTHRWNSEWKVYLDQCQDVEEERLEMMNHASESESRWRLARRRGIS
jgi:alkyl sulfatase BDS1-like metallo-beta-lactamase superfamily hydrolase